MKNIELYSLLLALIGIFVFPMICVADENTTFSQSVFEFGDEVLPEINPEPEIPIIDFGLVQDIRIELADGRVFCFVVPENQFESTTISHLLEFIKEDQEDTTITLYN